MKSVDISSNPYVNDMESMGEISSDKLDDALDSADIEVPSATASSAFRKETKIKIPHRIVVDDSPIRHKGKDSAFHFINVILFGPFIKLACIICMILFLKHWYLFLIPFILSMVAKHFDKVADVNKSRIFGFASWSTLMLLAGILFMVTGITTKKAIVSWIFHKK